MAGESTTAPHPPPSRSAQSATPTPAPAPPSCGAPEFRQFDFWLGEWEVEARGKIAGYDKISRLGRWLPRSVPSGGEPHVESGVPERVRRRAL